MTKSKTMLRLPRESHRRGLLVAAGALICAGTAYAESPATDEIIVTAQRRSEALQNVPISITAVSGEHLEKEGINRLEDIARISAGVQISRTGVFIQPAIRGVTTSQGNYAENNIAFYV